MKTVCIIHHVEPMWENAFNKEQLIESISDHFENNQYDQVILTTLEYTGGYDEISSYIDIEESWVYGWENPEDKINHEWYQDNDIDLKDIIPVSSHHEFAYVYPWIKDLKGSIVYLMGGSRQECLLDLIETLEYLGIEYNLIEECIYG